MGFFDKIKKMLSSSTTLPPEAGKGSCCGGDAHKHEKGGCCEDDGHKHEGEGCCCDEEDHTKPSGGCC